MLESAHARIIGRCEYSGASGNYLRRLPHDLELLAILTEVGLTLETLPDRGLSPRLDDRALWNYCQQHQFVLFTDNRNHEGENSLEATIQDSWHQGQLPVLTLANKGRFENSELYAARVAQDIADLLFSPI